MNYYLIAPAKSFHQSESLLTYESEESLKVGQIVEIPFGKQTAIGIITQKISQPDFATKPISKVLYDTPLPKHIVKALSWLSDYYRCPLSSVVSAILPRGITKSRRTAKTESQNTLFSPNCDNPLSDAQKRTISDLENNPANTVLLHGITGSGKTNIYIELAKHQLAAGKSVVLLVPEIALTSQLVQNFQRHFEDIILLHSEQTESVRHQLWQKALQADTPQVVIGPRSALFAPVKDLGLIIIDEAHEPAYHQDQNPKYSALRLASQMSKTVLGTATPLIADYYICDHRKAVVSLDELAIKNDKTAAIEVIDFKNRSSFTRSRMVSNQLIASIQQSLDNHQQALVFHNRRGTAPLTICDKCGWQSLCEKCLLPLVLHADKFQLRCHTCGSTYPVPTSCPECGNASIHHKGFGTKLIEEELHKLFPKAKIGRFDADTAVDQQLSKVYSEVKDGAYDILVGTQMLAKGFDFPKLSTLGVIQADAGLNLPDFSSEERTYQLLTQVIGRAKRGHQDSRIFIQTFQPEQKIIEYSTSGKYQDFYTYLLEKRQLAKLPPYTFLLKLSLVYKTEKATVANAQKLFRAIRQIIRAEELSQIFVTPPMPAFHERERSGYTWQIIIKAKARKDLVKIFDQLPKSSYLHYDFDPYTLL
ncbi:MAG: primosomal protein N' [Candidatus Saccharibacteria bacterium]|nr:primosomal protein N' [Candidatus Saccharibacteria bacterium]